MQCKNKNFKTLDALQSIEKVLNEATEALGNKKRTIKDSAISEVLGGALGAGIGGIGSFIALYALGTVGLSAAGVTSGIATAGAMAGGGMALGMLALSAPAVILAGAGIGMTTHLNKKRLFQEERRVYVEASRVLALLEKELKEPDEENEERRDYIRSLLILLEGMVKYLEEDLGDINGFRQFFEDDF